MKIQNNVSVYKGVTIEAGVFPGSSMVFTGVINPRNFIERKDEMEQILAGKGAMIGAKATVLYGTETGKYASIDVGAVVTKNAPGIALAVGNLVR